MGETTNNGIARAGRKWVHGLSADAPAEEAARLVVGERLRRPAELLSVAATDRGQSLEAVHQLRVATRRAQAALEAFEPLLEPKACAKAVKAMKRIRRAAGQARNCDVHLDLFGQRVQAAAAARSAAIGFVLGRIAAQREAARSAVADAADKWTAPRLKRIRTRVLDKIDSAGGSFDFATFGAEAVSGAQSRVQEASRANLRVFDNLHELRKAAKAMRYTLEIFRVCMDTAQFDRLYSLATEVQRRLGNLNDVHEMLERVRMTIDAAVTPASVAPALLDLRGQLERERDLARDRFLDWWAAGQPTAQVVVTRQANAEATP